MEILPVEAETPEPLVVARALEILSRGCLLIYPTDTLYALGGRALDAEAGRAVRAAKGREERKPLPLVVADVEQARGVCSAWTPVAERLARHFWPGPLSLVLPAAAALPESVTAGSGTVALRVPARALTRKLCAGAGPLISTSANRSGAAPGTTCADAIAQVGEHAALALDAGAAAPRPSTLLDLTQDPPRLLRAGVLAFGEVRAVLS